MRRPICIDIDNVIACTDIVLREAIRRYSKQGVNLRYQDVVHFDYDRCIDQKGRSLEPGEWPYIHSQFTLNYLDRIQPFERVQMHVQKLAQTLEIHLSTSRLPEGHDETRMWLSAHGIPYDQLHFVGHRKKHELAEGFAAAIDDDREQAVLFDERGVHAFLLAHPWNLVPSGSPVTRVDGWPNLVEAVLGRLS